MSALEDLYAAMAKLEESKRIVVCPPGYAQAVREYIDGQMLDGIVEIQVSKLIPEDRIYIFKPSTLEDMFSKEKYDPVFQVRKSFLEDT